MTQWRAWLLAPCSAGGAKPRVTLPCSPLPILPCGHHPAPTHGAKGKAW